MTWASEFICITAQNNKSFLGPSILSCAIPCHPIPSMDPSCASPAFASQVNPAAANHNPRISSSGVLARCLIEAVSAHLDMFAVSSLGWTCRWILGPCRSPALIDDPPPFYLISSNQHRYSNLCLTLSPLIPMPFLVFYRAV